MISIISLKIVENSLVVFLSVYVTVSYALEKKIHLLQASYISLYHLSIIYHHGSIKSSLLIMLLNLIHPYHYFCPLDLSISERGDCGALITLMALNNGLQVTRHLAYDFVAPTIKRWNLFPQILRKQTGLLLCKGQWHKAEVYLLTLHLDHKYTVLCVSAFSLEPLPCHANRPWLVC